MKNQKDNPAQPMTWTKCFAEAGSDSIIDLCHPVTERSQVNGETLEQIRQRYPKAQLVDFDAHLATIAARQDGETKTWQPITRERYWEMLEVLPPAAQYRGGFLVGEACDHHAGTGQPRFACFKQVGEDFFELSSHITHRQFCEIFGECRCYYRA